MRTLLQRVKNASVKVENKELGSIKTGLLIFLGIAQGDSEKDIDYLVEKIINLRIFSNEENKFDLSLKDINGEALIISQFTLYADCRRGRRPDFIDAAPLAEAEILYNKFIQRFKKTGILTAEGRFQAMMDIALTNDGPVTILLDSEK